MSFKEDFDESEIGCLFVIVETNVEMDINPIYTTTYHNYEIFGNDVRHDIGFELDLDKLEYDYYHFELRSNDKENRLIYSTEWNDDASDFVSCVSMSQTKNLEKSYEDMGGKFITLDRPFIYTSELGVHLYEIYLDYDVGIDGDSMYHNKINCIYVEYHIHKWLPNIEKHVLGEIGDVNMMNVPENIRNDAKNIKTHMIAKTSFSTLWLYRYYTGDIYIVNVEPKGKNKNKLQYYVVAHLHINNNPKCGDDCVCTWSEPEIDSLKNFLLDNPRRMQVHQYPNSSVIDFDGYPFIVQATQHQECCFINKSAIDFDIY